jgi:hypothetical protein
MAADKVPQFKPFISVGNGKVGIWHGNDAEGQLIKLLAPVIVAQARRQADAAKAAEVGA